MKDRVFDKLKREITLVAFLSLICASVIQHVTPDQDLLHRLKQILPDAETFEKVSSNPEIYKGYRTEEDGGKDTVGHVVLPRGDGYAGPLTVAMGVDSRGVILDVNIAAYKDTATFIQMLRKNKYLEKFKGKRVTDPLVLDMGIDAVSGATYSSRGVSSAISKGSFAAAREILGLSLEQEKTPIIFGFKEAVVAALIGLMLAGVILKSSRLRWVTLIGGLIFIGFKFNTPLSITNIASVLLGYFPSFGQNLLWYLSVMGILLVTLFLGKNVYCFWLCPFGAFQELTAKVGGGRFTCSRSVQSKARKIKVGFAYLSLLAAIVLANPGFASYEPFAPLFSLKGYGIQWFLLPVVVFSSFFISRIWCYYFCPIWVVLESIGEAGRRLKGLMEKKAS